MALKTVILAILLLLSLVSADMVQIKQQVIGTEVQELVDNRSSDGDGGNGVTPKNPIRAQQLGGSERQELMENGSGDGGMVAGGVSPRSECTEKALYHGPCLEMVCVAGCLLQVRSGGHCKGGLFGACMCFVCS
nr:unnamed protein product [Digitaria exilis]